MLKARRALLTLYLAHLLNEKTLHTAEQGFSLNQQGAVTRSGKWPTAQPNAHRHIRWLKNEY